MAAAHELKAPLALVRQLSLTLEQQDDLTPAERERMLRQIVLTSERALRLTSDLTKSSRQTELFPLEPINPQQLCEEVAHELTPLFAAHGKQIRVAPRKQPLLLVGNRDLLRRILLNFSDNALYYAGNQEVVELKMAARPKESAVRVGVRDYGPAVPPDTWRELTHRLQALAPQPVHARPQSSGLGLSIASQFAHMMNSRVGAARHVDGATFYVDAPASRQMSLL
jgi:signal transduction histidine kinase